jgi:hypothetical protein
MPDSTRPLMVLYVVWHPTYRAGGGIAEALYEHFRRKLFENVAGGAGISVIFRSAVALGSDRPLLIDLNDAEMSAIVVLAEKNFADDKAWCDYVHELVGRTEATGFGARVFPGRSKGHFPKFPLVRKSPSRSRVVLRPDVANARFEGSLVLSHEEFIEQKQIDIKLVAGAGFEPATFGL